MATENILVQLPIYESLGKNNPDRDHEAFLTPQELVIQTRKLMLGLQAMAAKQALPPTIVLLDKGARRIGEMIDILFPHFCPGEKTPTLLYINIGREKPSNGTMVIPFRGDSSIIREAYGSLLPSGNAPILILDDYEKSGDTLRKAAGAFAQAFPHAPIRTKVAFTKIPNWQGNKDYAGVEEYTERDYIQMAIELLKEELPAEESDILFTGDAWLDYCRIKTGDNAEIDFRLSDILRGIKGTIPHTKPLEHPALDQDAVAREIQSICAAILDLEQNKRRKSK